MFIIIIIIIIITIVVVVIIIIIILTNLALSWFDRSCLVLSCLILSCRVVSCLVLSYIILSCRVLSYLVVSCLVLSCRVVSCLFLSCLVIYYLVVYCLVLSCLILSCRVLSCLILSCSLRCRLCARPKFNSNDRYQSLRIRLIQFPCSQIYAVIAGNVCGTWIIIILYPMNAIVVLRAEVSPQSALNSFMVHFTRSVYSSIFMVFFLNVARISSLQRAISQRKIKVPRERKK